MSTPNLHLVKPAPPRVLRGRVPPHDTHTEADVLGELLTHPELVPLARGLMAHEDFFDDAHRVVAKAIYACHELVTDAGQNAEQVTVKYVVSWIKDRDLVQRVVAGRQLEGYQGGNTPAKLEHYLETLRLRPSCYVDFAARCERVKGKARMRHAGRELDRLLTELTGDYGDDVQAWLDGAVLALRKVAGEHQPEGLVPIGESVGELTIGTEELAGISTGLPELNLLTGGFQRGDCWTVTAPPGVGKTAYLLDRCIETAKIRDPDGELRSGVVLFSMEMPKRQVAIRGACHEALVDAGRVKNRPGELSGDELRALDFARLELAKLPLHVDYRKGLSVDAIRSTVERAALSFAREGKRLTLVGIDYFQLLGCPEDMRADRRHTRTDELDVSGRRVIDMSEELDVPVILLAQLTKCGTKIAECSALAKHTQNWLNLKTKKPADTSDDHASAPPAEASFTIRKQRNDRGRDESVACWFHGAYQRFSSEDRLL